ncbi:TetR/AcrR family transcriptional regulator [Paenibacillus sp. PL91]|uniref:TetR/AcrR family transcriptional regulator n=1 Tax=Paenibacillus sp. PL91 TaxID=2729538 RepID=UPI00145F7642|nr:TetR/AcrR family transcriptional regulator [Paenibacillus sp. PL91]MBC9201800.1 TetR/AcrR family transcriptional regulator [Paenibacillus sp. PL91]
MITGPSTAERIKQAALTMFTESGYEGASLSEIAKAVGIKTPSIYAHYKSKEQLFLQLIQEVIAEERKQYLELLQAIMKEPIKQQVYRLFEFFTDLNHLTTGQAFLKRTILVPPRHLRDQLRQDLMRYENELTEGLIEVLHKGASEGLFNREEEERLIATFYVCVDGILVENQLYEEELFEKRKRMVWQSLWQLWTMTARED